MKKYSFAILAAIIATLLHLVLQVLPVGRQIEPLAVDLWSAMRGQLQPPSSVAVVAMDEQSYELLDVPMNQAWPRRLHAELLKRLKELGAAKVVMDILFMDAGPDKASDGALAQSIRSIPTVLGADVGVREQRSAAGRYAYEELNEPFAPFAEAAETVALVRIPEDGGYVRRFAVERSQTSKFLRDTPTLSQAGAGVTPTTLGMPRPQDFIKFYGPPGSLDVYPYHQVLNPKNPLPASTFKNKVVFVGLFLRSELGPSLKDSYRTSSMSPEGTFGVEIHATAAANMIMKDWIKRASPGLELSILLLVTFGLIFGIFLVRPQWAALIAFLTSGGWFFLGYIFFLNGIFLPGFVLSSIVIPLAFLSNALTYYMVTLRSQQQVEKAFQFYLSPEMAKEMRKNPKGLELGGENVHATALFTDIAGFTEVTEKMLASEVSTMLNSYFTEVMDVIFERKGTLIKFIGDAVFALWGAPIKESEHARLAALTALEIQKNVEKFNSSKRFPPLRTRVGINTGPMVVGNLGSARRFDYTAIGDTVNAASRLEGLNKYFGTNIIVSENTRRELGDLPSATIFPLGVIQVVGKSEPLPIFALFDGGISPDILQDWNRALTFFRTRKWEQAAAKLNEVKELEPKLKKAAGLYLEELDTFKESPPPEEWLGQLTFTSK